MAGAASLKQAWEAVQKGLTLDAYSKDHEELRAAIEVFGGEPHT
jgi:ribulose-bisphosphate carboxylase large chain